MKLKVDGQEYDFPAVESLTMDETILLERVSGHNISELFPGESMPMGAMKAMVMIAVMRARPEVSEREISESIGKIKLTELDDLMTEADDAGPPEIQPKSDASTGTSGDDSRNGSEPSPDVLPLRDSGSQGSSPSDPKISAS